MRPDHLCQIQLSTSDSALFFQRRPRSYCEKPNRIQSGRPWPDGSGPEASRYAVLLQANTSKPVQIGCESDPVCLLGQVGGATWLNARGQLPQVQRSSPLLWENSGQVKSQDKGDTGLVTGVWVCFSDQNLSLSRTWKWWWILWICL